MAVAGAPSVPMPAAKSQSFADLVSATPHSLPEIHLVMRAPKLMDGGGVFPVFERGNSKISRAFPVFIGFEIFMETSFIRCYSVVHQK